MGLRSTCVIATLVSTACAQEAPSNVRGTVEGADQWSTTVLRVELGRHWISGSGATIVDVDEQGAFRAPAWANVAMAFVDVNDNGALDRFVEPSAHCARVGGSWSCPLTGRRIAAHRVVTSAEARVRDIDTVDELVVRAEDYDTTGAPHDGTTVCLAGRPDLCAEPGGDAYPPKDLAERARALSACQLKVTLAEQSALSLDVRSAQTVSTLELAVPPRMDLEVSIEAGLDETVVLAHANLPITHATIWLGDVDAGTTRWSTELDGASLRVEGADLRATLPFALSSTCPDCKVMLQVAHVDERRELSTYSEARHVLAVGGAP